MSSILATSNDVIGIGIAIETLRADLEECLTSKGISVDSEILDLFQSQWEAAEKVCAAYEIQPSFWSHGSCFQGFDIELFKDSRGVRIDIPVHASELDPERVHRACDFPVLNIQLTECIELKYEGMAYELAPESDGYRIVEPKFDVKNGKLCVATGSREHDVSIGGTLISIQ